MEVALPGKLDRLNMYYLIDQVIGYDLQPKSKNVSLNFHPLEFVEPDGVTVLSNLIEWLQKREVKVDFITPSRNNFKKHCPIAFLDDSLFFERYLEESQDPFASPRQTTIPLEIVAYKDSYQWLSKTIQWLSSVLNLSTESLVNIKVCLEEIFNNINDHSKEKIGCVFAQHYPNKQIVKVAISDFGVGIPHNVRTIRPSLSDAEAIEIATKQGFTTKSTPKNRGAGLDTLIYNVVNNNHGNVYIHSNYGILNCTYDGFSGPCIIPEDQSGFYPGTLIDLEFRTDTIEDIQDGEEEFDWYGN